MRGRLSFHFTAGTTDIYQHRKCMRKRFTREQRRFYFIFVFIIHTEAWTGIPRTVIRRSLGTYSKENVFIFDIFSWYKHLAVGVHLLCDVPCIQTSYEYLRVIQQTLQRLFQQRFFRDFIYILAQLSSHYNSVFIISCASLLQQMVVIGY